jgi:hypothetical protein
LARAAANEAPHSAEGQHTMPTVPQIDQQAFWLIVGSVLGAVAAIVGGIIGGIVTARVSYHYELKRAVDEKRKRWTKIVLEWAANGRKEYFRHIDLHGADLRGVNLGPAEENGNGKGADLSYGGLRGADLNRANLSRADLRLADLSDANLHNGDLRGADLRGALLVETYLNGSDLRGADLTKANLAKANLAGAKYNADTKWPEGFTPPHDAIEVDEKCNPIAKLK